MVDPFAIIVLGKSKARAMQKAVVHQRICGEPRGSRPKSAQFNSLSSLNDEFFGTADFPTGNRRQDPARLNAPWAVMLETKTSRGGWSG
jgi:hypothetical protein